MPNQYVKHNASLWRVKPIQREKSERKTKEERTGYSIYRNVIEATNGRLWLMIPNYHKKKKLTNNNYRYKTIFFLQHFSCQWERSKVHFAPGGQTRDPPNIWEGAMSYGSFGYIIWLLLLKRKKKVSSKFPPPSIHARK